MTRAAFAKKLLHGIEKAPAVEVGPRFSTEELIADRAFVTPTELWAKNPRLLPALRASGVREEEISGDAADFERLAAWLAALPATVGSTLAADLASDLGALGVSERLAGENAENVWRAACDALGRNAITPSALLSNNRATLVAVDITEPCPAHALGRSIYPLPSFDALFAVEAPDFSSRTAAISKNTGIAVADLASLEQAISRLLDGYTASGARAVMLELSGFDRFERPNPYHAGLALARGLAGEGGTLTPKERAIWRAQVLRMLGLAMRERGLRFFFRVRPKTEHVMGDFSVSAFEKLLSYLVERRAMVPSVLSLAAGDLPRGLARLLGSFCEENGTPLLCFGIEGAGATAAALSRSLRFYLERGAASLLLGITDADKGCFSAPTRARFARVLANDLARFATTDGAGVFAEQELLSAARAVFAEQAMRFFDV